MDIPRLLPPRGKEGVDCEQSEQDGAVQYNHTLPVAARHPSTGGEYDCFSNPALARAPRKFFAWVDSAGSARQCETLVEPGAGKQNPEQQKQITYPARR
jgi:hypothetical protein